MSSDEGVPAPQAPPSIRPRRLARRLMLAIAGGVTVLALVSPSVEGQSALGGGTAHASTDDSGGDDGAVPAEGTAPPDDGFTTEEWILLILLGIAVVAIVIGATAASTNRSEDRRASRHELNRRLRDITSGCRWVNGAAVNNVLVATTAADLRHTWNTARAHMIDLEGKIAVLASGTGDRPLDQSLSQLGQSLAGLRGAVDSNVQLRLRPDAGEQTVAIQMSSQTVAHRRQRLDDALIPVLAAQQ